LVLVTGGFIFSKVIVYQRCYVKAWRIVLSNAITAMAGNVGYNHHDIVQGLANNTFGYLI
jgi:hypothetical protein